ncbi:MAG TPA: AI-2E family transporter [Chitinophagaceae bacterium]|jgi:predicted PurR-regulated permease PerM|nr:AI-2E family transporter [Chitinophagaceae bacterium]
MDNHVIHQNRIRQVFFLILIALLGLLLFLELYTFLPALLGAVTLYIVMRKWMFHLTTKKKWRKSLTAALLMFLSLIIILLPIGVLINMLSAKITFAIQHSNELTSALKTIVTDLEKKFDVEIVSDENINKLGNIISGGIPKLLSATFNTLGTIFFMFFILYFMLVNGREMETSIYEHIPLKDENAEMLGKEVKNMVLSNAVGIPVIAILQGVVALIGYLIIGVKEPWFWFVVTCITAMLPVVGAALAYVPLAIIFFANGDTGKGIFMLIYGFGVIGTVDNVFRFTLAKKIGNIHPLVTVFGVIIGISLFGFIGLIFGPLLISMFLLLLKIYSSEFITKQRQVHHHHHHMEN